MIKALQQGDGSGLEMVFQTSKLYCVRHVMSRTQCSLAEAEELFVEAVVNFSDKVQSGKLDTVKNLKSYLAGTCYNMWLSRINQQRKHKDREPEVVRYYYDYMLEDYSDEEKIAEVKERLFEIMDQAMATLGEKCQALIKLFYVEGKSMTEISKLLGFANHTVAKSSKYKCYNQLRKAIKALEK